MASPALVLGVKVDLVSHADVLDCVSRWRDLGLREYICVTIPHSLMLCNRDLEIQRATVGARLILPDGVGIIWAAWILGYQHHGRVTGPDLMLYLCDKGREHGWRHFFYGGDEGVAAELAERLAKRFPGLAVAGTYCPPFGVVSPDEDSAILDRINATRPDIVWVGLGTPKQEKWMAVHVGLVAAVAMIGVGAAFDFHSGKKPWAPGWVRKSGFEWAYRLALEPRRLWRRNMDSPIFLLLVAWQRLWRGLGR